MRGKLFLRVFLGFWLITVAILASWLIGARYFDALALTPPAGDEQRRPPQRELLRMMYDLQNLEREQLAPMLTRLEEKHKLRIFVLDNQGRELRARPLPPPIRRAAAQLDRERGRLVIRTDQGTLLGHRFHREDSGRMKVLAIFPSQPRAPLRYLMENLWLRVLLTVLISGLLCYALSRLMTRRLARLEQAARQLADGDLDTRIEVRPKGGDETDDLARSFNSMAGELQQRMAAQRQLLSDVSHELRSPLARLRIALALAEEDTENQAAHLRRIDRETERLEELIGQLLSARASEVELTDHLDIGELLAEICESSRLEAEAEKKRVVYRGPQVAAVVATSGDLLYKCFENLVRNALQHSATNGLVSVTASLSAREVQITVQDSGPGVPADALERIFDTFYRVDESRSRHAGGYGLGLSIARRAIEQHGGSIRAENDSGLKVSVTLPLQTPG